MELLKWQRPAVNTETLQLKPCGHCCAPASLEYTETNQHEPDCTTVWRPICGNCKKLADLEQSRNRNLENTTEDMHNLAQREKNQGK